MNSQELSVLWDKLRVILSAEYTTSAPTVGYDKWKRVPKEAYLKAARLFDTMITDAVLQEMRERAEHATIQDPAPEGAAPARLGAPNEKLRNCS